jgi:hypothetical protein
VSLQITHLERFRDDCERSEEIERVRACATGVSIISMAYGDTGTYALLRNGVRGTSAPAGELLHSGSVASCHAYVPTSATCCRAVAVWSVESWRLRPFLAAACRQQLVQHTSGQGLATGGLIIETVHTQTACDRTWWGAGRSRANGARAGADCTA